MEDNNFEASGEPANIQIFSYSFDLTAEAPAGSINDVTITRNTCRNTINMCVFACSWSA
jgi:hypothetical protein